MKRIYTLAFGFVSLALFSQTKSTSTIPLVSTVTARFALDNATSTVGLVLTGPADRWFGLGIGVQAGFKMVAGDVITYRNGAVIDRSFNGSTSSPTADTNITFPDPLNDWILLQESVVGGVKTLVLSRPLTTAETLKDYQMPYETTNSFSIVGVVANTATQNFSNNHAYGYATATFATLGTEDFSLNATTISPNPASHNLNIKSVSELTKISLYTQVGVLLKSFDLIEGAKEYSIDVSGISAGVYLVELKNSTEKTWKKIVIE